jgi:formate dehydrogenase subunit beta
MATRVKIEVPDKNPVAAVKSLLNKVIDAESVGGVLVQSHLPAKGPPMPTLITDSDKLDRADPFAPAFPINAAKMAARLTHGRSGQTVAAVLRPCEIRAFIELVKLNQGSREDILIIGFDCLGAFDNRTYRQFLAEDDPEQSTLGFLGKVGGNKEAPKGFELAGACVVCEYPEPKGADIIIGLAGIDLHKELPIIAATPAGEALLNSLGLSAMPEGEGERREALDAIVEKRTAARDEMFEETACSIASMEGLADYLSGCVNCYNCRVACPVCYCKECVFVTDVFDHKPWQYMGWAKRRGSLKMPTDTLFYHLTRLAHMSTSCIGCGQCSNACPNDVPVMELFKTVAAKIQAGFEYSPGRSLEEPPPLSVFKEDEFSEVVQLMHH